MSTELNKAMVRRYLEAYHTGDMDAVMEFLDPNHVLHPGGGEKPMNLGERRSDELRFFSAFSDIQAIVEDQIAEGDKVVSRITMWCTHTGEFHGIPATGKRIVIPYVDIALIRAGKILEEWIEFDMMSILRKIGARSHQQ